MPGQMLKIQRRPSTSFLKAWRARRKLVLTGCIHCSASFSAICSMLRLWRVAFCPGTAEAVYAF